MATTARLDRVRRGSVPVRKTRTHEPHEGAAILRHLVDFLDAFMWEADPTTLDITFVTASVGDILGHPVSEWLGGPDRWSEHIHPDDRERVIDCLRATAADGADREVEFQAQASDGRTLALRHAVRLLTPASGAVELWGVTTDVTGDKRTAETLRVTQERYRALSVKTAEFRRQALEDPLTRIPNRILFDDRLRTTLRSAERNATTCGVLLMDLDRFKSINDTLGHQAGDLVLKDVALRFRICLRGQDTPARLGGDEFAAVLPNTDSEGAIRVAERMIRALRAPFTVEGSNCTLGVSIGIALFPAHGSDPDELLARADVAMYRAKAAGGGYAVADGEDEMPHVRALEPPDRRRRRRRHLWRMVIGSAASLAIVAGAMTLTAQGREPSVGSAARLHAAAAVLQSATAEEVGDGVRSVEQALAEISWKDFARRDVASALNLLERMLHGLEPDLAGLLGQRFERLIASIRQAEAVGRLSDGSTGSIPKVRVKETPPTSQDPHATARPTNVATPEAEPAPAPLSLP